MMDFKKTDSRITTGDISVLVDDLTTVQRLGLGIVTCERNIEDLGNWRKHIYQVKYEVTLYMEGPSSSKSRDYELGAVKYGEPQVEIPRWPKIGESFVFVSTALKRHDLFLTGLSEIGEDKTDEFKFKYRYLGDVYQEI